MATFEVRVEGLTGLAITGSSSPTQDQLTEFLKDGVIDVTSKWMAVKPMEIESFARESSEQTANASLDLNGARIISVVREGGTDNYWRNCNKILAHQQYDVIDENSLYFSTEYQPVYMLGNDSKVSVFPAPVNNGTDTFKVYYVNNVPVDKSGASLLYSHSDIGYFIDDKVYLVVIYASMKSLQSAMAGLHSNADITTALTAMNTELDETQVICDLINTQVDSAVSEIAESATQVDASIDTALAAISTAAGRVNTAVILANAEFDKAVLESAQAEGEADDGAIGTALTAINTNVDSAVSTVSSATTALGLANTRIATAKAEIDLAKGEAAEIATQTDNSGDLEIACDAVNTELDKVAAIIVEASTEFDKTPAQIVLASAEFDKCDTILDKGEVDSETAVNTAAAKIIVELDETQAVCDKIDADLVLAKAEIVLAKAEAAELATQTANNGNIETALDGMATAVAKFRADGSDPALFGDEATYHTGNSEMTRVKDALDNAKNLFDTDLADDDGNSAESVLYWLNDEDPEMVQATIAGIGTEIQRAQAHIAEWNTTVQTLSSEINGFAAEAGARASFSSAKTQAVQGHISTAQSYVATAQGFGGEVQSKIGIANGYIAEITIRLQQASTKREESRSRVELGSAYIQESSATIASGNTYLQEAQAYVAQAQGYATEVNTRAAFTGAKSQAVQAYVNTAQAYLAEVAQDLGLAAGYGNVSQTYLAAAQGFAAEVQAYQLSTQIFAGTTQNRINVGNSFLAEAAASGQEAQTYANEVNARIAQVGGYGQVAGAYINAAQGFASELNSKIAISQGYGNEMQMRMANLSQEYQWYNARYQELKADYSQAFGIARPPAQRQEG